MGSVTQPEACPRGSTQGQKTERPKHFDTSARIDNIYVKVFGPVRLDRDAKTSCEQRFLLPDGKLALLKGKSEIDEGRLRRREHTYRAAPRLLWRYLLKKLHRRLRIASYRFVSRRAFHQKDAQMRSDVMRALRTKRRNARSSSTAIGSNKPYLRTSGDKMLKTHLPSTAWLTAPFSCRRVLGSHTI